jgi:hypothetical protein
VNRRRSGFTTRRWTVGGGLRYFGGAVAFGFAAMWILASLTAALVCLLSAALAYGAVLLTERTRAKPAIRASSPGIAASSTLGPPSRTPTAEEVPLWADALNSDLGHIYEPTATTSPLAREAEYGWPLNDDAATPSETLH